MLLSFIIPAYNASKTIARSLQSVYAIGLLETEFEVICIDDCSTDNTIEIINEYAKKHINLILLKQPENHRQGAARNRGIEVAKGKYLMFMDSDDEIIKEGLVNALKIAIESTSDIISCSYKIVFSSNKYWDIIQHQDMKSMSALDFANDVYDPTINNTLWSYLWNRKYVQSASILFEIDKRMEDTDWIEKMLMQAKKVVCTPDMIYKYFVIDGSTMRSFKYDTFGDLIHNAYRRLKFASEIKHYAPNFANKIVFQASFFVNSLTFKRTTRFSNKKLRHMFLYIGDDCLDYLKNINGWNSYPNICLKYRWMMYIINAVAFPFMYTARAIVHNIKN